MRTGFKIYKSIIKKINNPKLLCFRFVANQFALGNEIMLALGQVKDRLAETKVRVVISDEKRLADGLEKNM